MSRYDYELFVIGAGSGGVRAARMAAREGVRVGLAESARLGGTCVNQGCVPKKLYVYGSHYHDDFSNAKGYGWTYGKPQFDWERLQKNKDQEIQRLNGVYARLLEEAGVELFYAHARLVDEHSVELEETENASISRAPFLQGSERDTHKQKIYPHKIHAQKILIATGSSPYIPDFSGCQYVANSNHIFAQKKLPERVLVVGGGYIAVEFASIFAGLGLKTDLVYRGELFLRRFDISVRKFLEEEMQKKNVKLHFQSPVKKIEQEKDGSLCVFLETARKIYTDQVLYATGRVANTKNLGLEKIGVGLDSKGNVKVDSHFRTNIDSVYALGDVIGRVQLTPVAIAEAMVFVRTQIRKKNLGELTEMDYECIPTAIFSQPSIGSVGLSEEQAREKYKDICVYESNFRALKHSLSGNEERTLVKLVTQKDSGRVLGAHMVGAEAAEIIQGLAIALKAGANKAHFDACIGIHPTSAEEFVSLT